MGDEVDPGVETSVAAGDDEAELTAEQAVAADMAMLLDLGESEALAERIAAQSAGGDTVVDRRLLLDLGESEGLAERIAAQSAGGDTVVDRRLPAETEAKPEPHTGEQGPMSPVPR